MKQLARKIQSFIRLLITLIQYTFKYRISPVKLAIYYLRGFKFKSTIGLNLNRKNWKNYITDKESERPRIKKYNINQNMEISDNKAIFSLVMGKYVNTPVNIGIVFMGKYRKLEGIETTFTSELQRSKSLFVKPAAGYDGQGVHLFSFENGVFIHNDTVVSKEDIDSIISKLNQYVVQKIVTQGKYANELYPRTINTIRLITYRKGDVDRHIPVAAVQRVGTEESFPADNFSTGGLSFYIDMKTGKLGKGAYKFAKPNWRKRDFYECHPETGVKIEGRVIPGWEKIIDEICKTTENFPYFNFIAWDIAIQDDGFTVIETNMKSSLDVFQTHNPQRYREIGDCFRSLNIMK